jgi:crotonobetainyl-CoA:carnitine CoA-transferase CaiB-like acyl-CoA transferase
MAVTGDPAGEPFKVGTFIVDFITGLYGAISVLGALRHREVNKGAGQSIDVALLDCGLAAMAGRAVEYFASGKEPERIGNKTPGSAPAQVFLAADGYIAIQAGIENHYRDLCHVVGRPDLITDERFKTRADRVRNVGELDKLLSEPISKKPVRHWYEALVEAEVICAPVYWPGEVYEDPHVIARGVKRKIPHPVFGELDIVSNPIRYAETPIEEYRVPPSLGQDTAEVLADWLGYTPEQTEQARASGAF